MKERPIVLRFNMIILTGGSLVLFGCSAKLLALIEISIRFDWLVLTLSKKSSLEIPYNQHLSRKVNSI